MWVLACRVREVEVFAQEFGLSYCEREVRGQSLKLLASDIELIQFQWIRQRETFSQLSSNALFSF